MEPVIFRRIFAMIASAQCCSAVSASPQAPVVPDVVKPLSRQEVRLSGGPLKQAQDVTRDYLLKLDPDRMLAYYRIRARLKQKAEPYGGWDGGGRNLTGHILGHYLSAICYMWQATGDEEFKRRAERIVAELKEVQAAYPDGYLGALEGGRESFEQVAKGDIRSAGFDLNGLWAPFYVYHKLFAGLRDAYRILGNEEALKLEVGFAGWVEGVFAKLDEAQVQKVLHTEFGGMNEVLADLYHDTGDARWLRLSHRFEHEAVLGPLKRHQDCLEGIHGNTQVPKLIGSLARFSYTGDAADAFAAGFFWDRVVGHHSYATGGHGKDEYFGAPDRLYDRVDGRTAESCNIYNMLKMTRKLFALRPDAHYLEFQERALFNHVLSSIDPEDGRTCYMVPVGRGVQREYQDLYHSFTCCVGSGMESHALHADGMFSESADRLWVNLYSPAVAQWKSAGVTCTVETDFPLGEVATLTLAMPAAREFTLSLRRPAWTGEGFQVRINGELQTLPRASHGGFVDFKRTWKPGDRIEVALPKSLRLEPVPDRPERAAILWGPLVLAGDLGPEQGFASWEPGAIPVLVTDQRPPSEWLKPVDGKPGTFRTVGVGQPKEVTLMPFYQLQRRTYAVYWDFFNQESWKVQQQEIAKQRERDRKLALATVAFAQPGEMQPERDFNQQGENTGADRVRGRPCRRASGWFSFDLPIDPARPAAVVVTYYSDEWRKRTFDVLANGKVLGSESIVRGGTPRFYDVEYAIPAEAIAGKDKVTIRFQATQGNETAAVYGIRTIRADAER